VTRTLGSTCRHRPHRRTRSRRRARRRRRIRRRARRRTRIRSLARCTTEIAVLRPDPRWIICGRGWVQHLDGPWAREAGGPHAAVGANRAVRISSILPRDPARGARMCGSGARRSARREGWCRHKSRRHRRHGADVSRRGDGSAAAPPELAKHLGSTEDDIANHSATVGPSEKGDCINGSTNNAKRRRRSGRSRIHR
jgi:hypothetical protein